MSAPTLAPLLASASTLLPSLASAQEVDGQLAGVWTMTALEMAGANSAMQPVPYGGQIAFTADGHVAV